MSEIVRICGGALLAVCALLLLKDAKKEYAVLVTLTVLILVFSKSLTNVSSIIDYISRISSGSGLSSYVSVLIKAAGFAYITDLTVEICKSAGENQIAGFVEIAGKTEMIILALPLVTEALDLSFGMLNI